MTTDTSEKDLEALICTTLIGSSCNPGAAPASETYERPIRLGWICGDPSAYGREYCVDLAQLALFLRATQPDVAKTLDLTHKQRRAHPPLKTIPPAIGIFAGTFRLYKYRHRINR